MPSAVILLSDKRSGSTMFQDEICRHSAVRTVPYSPHSNLETHWWLMAAVLLQSSGRLFSGGQRYKGYGSRANARAYMVDLLEKSVPDFAPPSDDYTLVFQGWDALCRKLAQPVFFEKSPQFVAHWAALTLLLDWIEQTDLEVRVVGLVRNPHGVMYSAARQFGTDPASRQIGWLATCRNLLAFSQMLGPEQFTLVRYEDLIRDPISGFADICRFIGLAPEAQVGSGTHRDSSEKWRADPRYRLALDPSVRQMARHMGYAHAELENANAASSPAETAAHGVTRSSFRLWINRRRDRLVQPLLIRLRASLRF
ncbi:sulfotransferase family protein [Pontibaca salina]|uniref:Sulfotransferase n=1 Tax=Pontibaca salina TaxID=2795731 RepID=A0A934HNI6_9RHOB|nr:sulfotransferase [Pontibaca salina]MBI6630256.1 sulfotransferase [Pontibaca salina]